MSADAIHYEYSEIESTIHKREFPSFVSQALLEDQTLAKLNALYTAPFEQAEQILNDLENNTVYADALYSLAQKTQIPLDLRAQATKCFTHQQSGSDDLMTFVRHKDPLIREAVLCALDELRLTALIRTFFSNDADETIRSLAQKVR